MVFGLGLLLGATKRYYVGGLSSQESCTVLRSIASISRGKDIFVLGKGDWLFPLDVDACSTAVMSEFGVQNRRPWGLSWQVMYRTY